MLRQQVSSAQSDLEANIEALSRAAASGGDGTPLLSAQSQFQGLSRLQHRIANAHGGNLAAIRAEVLASIAATQVFVQQVRSATTAAQSAEAALHSASEAAHREVTAFVHDFYDRKIFDPYLRFSSPEDEEAYRKREADCAEKIKAALAEGTPEGNLRATRLAREQLKDAGIHGADQSPDFPPLQSGLANAEQNLSAAVRAKDGVGVPPTANKAAKDELDDVAPAPEAGLVDRQLIAKLRASGAVASSPIAEGHGLVAQRVVDDPRGRG